MQVCAKEKGKKKLKWSVEVNSPRLTPKTALTHRWTHSCALFFFFPFSFFPLSWQRSSCCWTPGQVWMLLMPTLCCFYQTSSGSKEAFLCYPWGSKFVAMGIGLIWNTGRDPGLLPVFASQQLGLCEIPCLLLQMLTFGVLNSTKTEALVGSKCCFGPWLKAR